MCLQNILQRTITAPPHLSQPTPCPMIPANPNRSLILVISGVLNLMITYSVGFCLILSITHGMDFFWWVLFTKLHIVWSTCLKYLKKYTGDLVEFVILILYSWKKTFYCLKQSHIFPFRRSDHRKYCFARFPHFLVISGLILKHVWKQFRHFFLHLKLK